MKWIAGLLSAAFIALASSIGTGAPLPVLIGPAWPMPNAAVDLDLQGNRATVFGQEAGLPTGMMSITRATSGMAQYQSGLWQNFASGAFRITDNGLLVEEARTNSIRNNSMVGAVPGTPGTLPTNWRIATVNAGLTVTVIATGTENGLPYVDLEWSGSPSVTSFNALSFEAATQVAATTGQTWGSSFFYKLVGGSLANVTNITHVVQQVTLGGVFVANAAGSPLVTPTSSIKRSTFAAALAGGATVAFIDPDLVVTGVIGNPMDFTLRLYTPQLELGAFVTSPILTTAAAATRNADVVQFIGSAALLIPASASAFFQTSGVEGIGTSPVLAQVGTLNSITVTSTTVAAASDGTNTASGTVGSGTFSGVVKTAYGMDNTSMTVVANGGTKGTQGTSTWTTNAAAPSYLGNRADGTKAINAYLQRATFAIPKGVFDNRTSP